MKTGFSRRDFLKILAVVFGSGIASACERILPAQTPVPISTTVPTKLPTPTITTTPQPECSDNAYKALAQVVPPDGERYLADVPDTLDIQECAELAINALTRCTNPETNYEPYFYGNMMRNPPVMYRLMPFYGKFWDGLGLMRQITGSSINDQVDQHWRGLFVDWFKREKPGLEGPDGGRMLCWIANNYRFERNPCWAAVADRAINTLLGYFISRGDYGYFAHTEENGPMPTGWEATFRGWTLQGATKVYSTTGSQSAQYLAAQLARFLKDHSEVFSSDGGFLARHPSIDGMEPALHFHHNGNAMAAISEYALATCSEEFASFAQKGYEYGISIGWPLLGYFPEYINDWPDQRPYADCETCCIADMIIMAINLSKIGIGDYWDDVDRYVRNQFAENQLRNTDWINEFASKYPTTPVGEGEDGYQVAERVVGSFSGWAMANDYLPPEGESFISGCCTGNGARALFHIWDNMLEFDTGRLMIHLLLNRASPWVDVNSYLPYEGRVDVKIKAVTRLSVRSPEWVRTQDMQCTVNGNSRRISFHGRYALVDDLKSGDLVTFTFPIAERTIEITIGNVTYRLVIKGNDVVAIDPLGRWQPFYQRTRYRENAVRWVKRERFILAI